MISMWEFPFRAEVWGTVGQWSSSIFAGLSVLVALSIIRRDRAKDQWMEARKVTTTALASSDSPSPDGTGGLSPRVYQVPCEVRNGGDEPIYDVRFRVLPKNNSHLVEGEQESPTIESIESHGKGFTEPLTFTYKDGKQNYRDFAEMILRMSVRFTSHDGVEWEVKAGSGSLKVIKRANIVKRILRKVP